MIYLDYTATTPVIPEVKDVVIKFLDHEFGNPSSPHKLGTHAAASIERVRKILLKSLNLENTHNCIFTSGGSEGNSMVISGVMKGKAGKKMILSDIEHNSVRKLATELLIDGTDIVTVSPDDSGHISIEQVLSQIDENTKLVSIMSVNNETGYIFDVENMCRAVKKTHSKVLFHTDCVQSYMKIPMNLTEMDFITVSAHKIYGPKGVGALFMKKNLTLPSLISGSHEYGLRGGTQNVSGIMGMGKAVELASVKINENLETTGKLRNIFLKTLSKKLDSYKVLNGSHQSPYILGLLVEGIKSEVVVRMLSEQDIFVSAGSACSAKEKVKSTTAGALGHDGDYYLRVSISPMLSEEQVIEGAAAIAETCKQFKDMMS